MDDRDEQNRRLVEQMKRQLGLSIVSRIYDPLVTDILLNPDGIVFEDRAGSGMQPIGCMSVQAATMFIGTAASMVGATVTADNPILECKLFNGARFEAIIPPVVAAPVFAIRCHATRIYTLDDYVIDGIMTPKQKQALERAVAERKNIIISGGTKTGKTTLANAVAQEIARVSPDDRIVVLEDTPELQCPNRNVVTLLSTSLVDHLRLLKATMRLRPDRIIVGEVRGGEALAMLKAWNTGHEGGFGTIHANNVRATLTRLEQLVAEVSQTPMQELIAEAVDLIVSIVRVGTGRRVEEIARVTGYTDHYQLEYIGE